MTASVPHRPPARRVPVAPVAVLAVLLVAAGLGVRALWIRIDRSPGRDDRHRVLFVGDSMMIQASRQLDSRFTKAGAETRFIGYPGTGLLSGQGWWNREITHAVDTWHPDVVVIEACCNYQVSEPAYRLPDGTTIEKGSAAMYETWAAQTRDAVDRAGAHGAKVYWVTTPAVSDTLWPSYGKRIERFQQSVEETGVDRIDWRKTLTPDGTFTPTLPIDGKQVRVRDPDGLHLTPEGNALVVEATWKAIAEPLGVA